MGVPLNLKSNAHIYRYSSDLEKACTTLKSRLEDPCWYTVVQCGKGTPTGSKGDQPYVSGDKVAWLVGHGGKSHLKIGTLTHKNYVNFNWIMNWLISNGFKVVVDTCCEPQSRKSEFKKTYKSKIRYFCAPATHTVSRNEDHNDLDDWWDRNQMAEVT